MNKKFSWGNLVIGTFVLLFTLLCLLPMILTFMVSITDETSIMRYGYSFIPKKISLYAYQLMFQDGSTVIEAILSPFLSRWRALCPLS